MKRHVYSVRRARQNLLVAIRLEIDSTLRGTYPQSLSVAARERAIRDLIASVRAERAK